VKETFGKQKKLKVKKNDNKVVHIAIFNEYLQITKRIKT
jgi:hypothetical protein